LLQTFILDAFWVVVVLVVQSWFSCHDSTALVRKGVFELLVRPVNICSTNFLSWLLYASLF
jgi:hypothetical protein